MLEGLDNVPWEDLENEEEIYFAFGSCLDIPVYLRQLISSDPQKVASALTELFEACLHQGTRSPGTIYVLPFIIELCGETSLEICPAMLSFWRYAITGFFSIQQRPHWGDGEKIYDCGKVDEYAIKHGAWDYLHDIYRESLKGQKLLYRLLQDRDPSIRQGAVGVLACMPTIAESSVPKLEALFNQETSQYVRAGIAFALGELGAVETLRKILAEEGFTATKCMAACQLARIAPEASLIEPLLEFVNQPIANYDCIIGAGGESTGDAAFSISHLPRQVQQQAIPELCQLLKRTRSFATIPIVETLLSAAFEKLNNPFQKEQKVLTKLTDIQKLVLSQMLLTDELWSMANLMGTFAAYGLPHEMGNRKEKTAQLVGMELTPDQALKELREGLGLSWAEMGCFLENARDSIDRALQLDSTVIDRSPAPAEAWLLCARAFAKTDRNRSIEAFRQAYLINPAIVSKVTPDWHLANLLEEFDF